ncbi:MAG: ABC transporter ATP-binding protein [Bacillota bacterium]
MASPAISVRGLVQQYQGQTVLSVPELDIEAGTVLTLLGPNGSGKSTLLRLMGLLEKPTSGSVAFSGKVPQNAGERLDQRRRMVMVFQDPLLFRGTVYDNVAYGLRLRKFPRHLTQRRVQETLDLVGLGPLGQRDVATLSGGEAQKAALARALALEPEILFLDEPTAYLDAPARQGFRDELLTLLDALHITTVFVTHDRTEARLVSRSVAVLFDGVVEQTGPVEDVFRRPGSARLAAFLGVENLFSAVAEPHNGCARLRAKGLELTASTIAGGEVTVGLRPQDLYLESPESPAGNAVVGTIRRLLPEGAAYRLEADCGVPLVVYVSEQEVHRWGLGPGRPVRLSIDPQQVLVYGTPGL